MKNLKDLYIRKLGDKYCAEKAFYAVKNRLESAIQRNVDKKYFNMTTDDGRYIVKGVRVWFPYPDCVEVDNITIRLHCFINTKLQSKRKKQLEEELANYERFGTEPLSHCSGRNPLWVSYNYSVKFDQAIDGRVNLQL